MLCTLQVWHSISESVLFLREQEQEKCQGIRSIANKLVTESLGVWSRFYPTSIFEASRNITIIDEKFSVLDPLTSFKPEILIKGAGWKRSEKRWYRILLLLFFFFFFFFTSLYHNRSVAFLVAFRSSLYLCTMDNRFIFSNKQFV